MTEPPPPKPVIAPGVPNWVDLGTSDLADAIRFYAGLFGWTAQVTPQPEAGAYTIFQLDGVAVAGAGPLFGEGQSTAWSTYLATDDADLVARRVEAAGGTVLTTPFDVPDQGRMAAFQDQAGAAFSVWQPLGMPGAGVFNVPGSLSWNELTTRDPDGSKVFYEAVFGWAAEDQPMGPITYTGWRLGDRVIAGMLPMVGEEWGDLPAHWMVYFAVEDADAAAARAEELGGTVAVPPNDLPQGRFAVLTDPQGAIFSVIRLNPAG
ncbi:VOC family protein [Solwaraspora sp. WMMD1047]|uniref:VOC family protein n=1 Tax=Solwaraspora sp. WMMD1047 TaxID=3016102 RepID=UPI002415D723|nr:VOC family protein [Solwaraspora sp. WMMD1047]MDG4827929.1 VOC family protein [Solwaraspora sp. WMMD1047]